MQVQQLTKGVHYGIAFENTSSVDALMRLVHMLTPFEIDSLLVLPYRVNDDFTKLASRLDALSLEGFQGVVVVSVLVISCTDDALFACLNLRDALNSPELTLISVASSERKAELAKALAISGFSDFPTR